MRNEPLQPHPRGQAKGRRYVVIEVHQLLLQFIDFLFLLHRFVFNLLQVQDLQLLILAVLRLQLELLLILLDLLVVLLLLLRQLLRFLVQSQLQLIVLALKLVQSVLF